MIDPKLILPEMPSKQMWIMVSKLEATQSGSFLVLYAKIALAQLFPQLVDYHQPSFHMLSKLDQSLIEEPLPIENTYQLKFQLEKRIEVLTNKLAIAKQVIRYCEFIEQANTAMLVIQDMILQKINEMLYTKEKGKKTKI